MSRLEGGMERSTGTSRLPTIKVRIPKPLLAAVAEHGRLIGDTRTAAVRDLLVAALTARGLWPPERVRTQPDPT